MFAAWAEVHHVPLTRASRQQVAAYISEQLAHVTASTASSRLFSLRSFFAFCRDQGWRNDNPTAGIRIKVPKQQPRPPYTAPELRRLLAACRKGRERAMVLVLMATGIRVSEMLGMQAGDIDWGRSTVVIHGKGKKERLVPLGRNASSALAEQVNGKGPVWPENGEYLSRYFVRDMLEALGKRASVERTGAHRFRITFANDYLMTGGDIGALQLLMGHADVQMTCHYAGWTAAERGFEHCRRFCLADRL